MSCCRRRRLRPTTAWSSMRRPGRWTKPPQRSAALRSGPHAAGPRSPKSSATIRYHSHALRNNKKMAITYRVGVDIGGTFTDIVLLGSDGTIHTKKISSSVENYAQAIVDGLSEVFGESGLLGAA